LIPGKFSLVDMQATVLGLAGVDKPPYDQGTDFSPALRGKETVDPDAVLLEMEGNPSWHLGMRDWRGLIYENWKYSIFEGGEEILYDLESDPYEMNNVIADEPDRRDRMRARLLQELSATREPYFDVIIEHGCPQVKPDIDANDLDWDGILMQRVIKGETRGLIEESLRR
jgi:arylsulfatase A-like enzyme